MAIPYHTQEKWVEFYTQWATALTKALGLRHNEMDREDAVFRQKQRQAFLMAA